MTDPLEGAQSKLDLDEKFRRQSLREHAWHRYLARQYIIDAIESFLSRMPELKFFGAEETKTGFRHKEQRWQIQWIQQGARGGFLLTTEGLVSSSMYEAENEHEPYSDMEYFGMDGEQVRTLEQEGAPEPQIYKGSDLKYMPEAKTIALALASIIKEAEGHR